MPSKKLKTEQVSRSRGIEADTNILPDVVAETVVNMASKLLDINLPYDLTTWLVGYAEAAYLNNKEIRKKIRSNADRGNAGRDWLYSFMEHWLSSEILRRCGHDNDFPRIRGVLETSGFTMGHYNH